jgi:peptidoglycan/LPS O-acetylase OafA/YrhL
LPQNKSAKSDHLPSLDGLRAISIALVLVGHLSATRGFVRLDLGIGDYAHLGVVVFFVISGFLITRLMLSERAKSGHVSLKLFYARRALRLFPATYAFIACVGLLWWPGLCICSQEISGTPSLTRQTIFQADHGSLDTYGPFPSRSSFT